MNLGVVILAAGQGTRMKSRQPKVLHSLAGRPLLSHVIDTARALQPSTIIVVYGHGGEQVRETLDDEDLVWVTQQQQLGTGHAVQQAMPWLQGLDKVLVLYGDVPLIRAKSLSTLIRNTETGLGVMTVSLEDPTGYGRLIRDESGNVLGIVEQKDASAEQLAVQEINTGIMLIDVKHLDQ